MNDQDKNQDEQINPEEITKRIGEQLNEFADPQKIEEAMKMFMDDPAKLQEAMKPIMEMMGNNDQDNSSKESLSEILDTVNKILKLVAKTNARVKRIEEALISEEEN